MELRFSMIIGFLLFICASNEEWRNRQGAPEIFTASPSCPSAVNRQRSSAGGVPAASVREFTVAYCAQCRTPASSGSKVSGQRGLRHILQASRARARTNSSALRVILWMRQAIVFYPRLSPQIDPWFAAHNTAPKSAS